MSREYVDVELAKQLRAQGHTMKFIADYMGISRRVLYTLRKRGEIELEEKRVYVGREKIIRKKSPVYIAACALGFQSVEEMMRHYRIEERKTLKEISILTGTSIASIYYRLPEELRGVHLFSKEGIENIREGLKKAHDKNRLIVFNGKHITKFISKRSKAHRSL